MHLTPLIHDIKSMLSKKNVTLPIILQSSLRMQRFFLPLFFIISLLASCSEDVLDFASYNSLPGSSASVPDNGLPIVIINTADGMGVTSKTEWKDATIAIRPQGTFEELQTTDITLKGRGNSTSRFPKKSFNIKFEEKRKLLGMKKAKKWVFLANYRDPTLLRNDLTLHIGQMADGLEWTPRGEFVDLVFNGNYVGNYYLCEKINVNKQHVDIDEMTAEDIAGEALTGGYLLQFDSTFDEPNRFKTQRCKLPVGILSPDEDVCQPEQVAYITNYLNTIETLLTEGDFATLYNEYLDLNSFVDYFLVQAFCGNNDFNSPRSVYVYKKRNGKLYAGPLWDFDFSTYYKDTTGLHQGAWWYRYLFSDQTFRALVKERWSRLSSLIEAETFDYLEKQKNYIFRSMIANFQVFPYNYTLNHNTLVDSGFLIGYNDMVKIMHERIAFMNQYCNSL